jgi:hypothetical protein
MLQMALALTAEIGGTLLGWAVVLAILGWFTQKRLNPAYEQMIESRIEGVTRFALLAIGLLAIWLIAVDGLTTGVASRIIRGVGGPLMIAVWGICGYLISRRRGNPHWKSALWGLFSMTLFGFLVQLQCANYHHAGDPLSIPVYRGKKITFRCASCACLLKDFECNAGNVGVCGKCGHSQTIPHRSGRPVRTAKENLHVLRH